MAGEQGGSAVPQDHATKISALDARMDGMEKGLMSLTRAVENLGERFGKTQATQWSPLLVAVGLIVTIIIAVGGLASAGLKEGVVRNEQGVRDLDVVLQRELTTGDANLKDSMAGLEQRLSEGSNARDKTQAQSIENVAAGVVLEVKRLEATSEGRHNAQGISLESLRRDVERLWRLVDPQHNNISLPLDSGK